jgi:nicotinamide mononucleotide adenylyltransferase
MEGGEGDEIHQTHGRLGAFFAYGRFNPPTIGHKLLIEELIRRADEAHADAYVFATSTQDSKKNPLEVGEKVAILKKMYPDTGVVRIINTTTRGCKTVPQVKAALVEAGYEHLTMVVGSDRVADFTGKFGVDVVSAGERDPDSENATGMSATKVRTAALSNAWPAFRSGINESVKEANARMLMRLIQERMPPGSSSTAPKSRRRDPAGGQEGGARRSSRRGRHRHRHRRSRKN